jgi:hypothetical protein
LFHIFYFNSFSYEFSNQLNKFESIQINSKKGKGINSLAGQNRVPDPFASPTAQWGEAQHGPASFHWPRGNDNWARSPRDECAQPVSTNRRPKRGGNGPMSTHGARHTFLTRRGGGKHIGARGRRWGQGILTDGGVRGRGSGYGGRRSPAMASEGPGW